MAGRNKRENARLSFAEIASLFARHANFTVGGGNATTAVLHRVLTRQLKIVSQDDFQLCFGLARLTPGPNLLALCTGLGWLLGRLPGAIAALLAASAPSAAIVTGIAMAFSEWRDNRLVTAAIHGAIAAAIAITVASGVAIVKPLFASGAKARVLLIGVSAFALHVFLAIPALQIVLMAALLGALLPSGRA